MMLAIGAALAAILLYYVIIHRNRTRLEPTRETTPALDKWLSDALEMELAEGVLGFKGSTVQERKPITKTLANEPDADVVAKIEEKVKSVEIEYVKYAHEIDVEVILRVRYEDGKTGTSSRRMTSAEIPAAVNEDFKKLGGTRVFRSWEFPWQRARAL
jgi:hypothetical protein